MRLALIASAMLIATAAHAQITNCIQNGYGYSCYINPVGPRVSPLESFLNGYMQGRMWRLQVERQQMENELLRRRLYGGQ